MKKIILFIFATQLFCMAAFAQSQTYDVNFKNISMKEFITFVASFTGTNIVYNETDLRGTVSIASQYPMTAKDIMEIFYATLNSNGLSAVQEDGYIRVVPDKDMPVYMDDFTMQERLEAESFVTTVVLLRNYNATALANTFNRVKSKHGTVEALRGVNGLIVRDFGYRIEKMREIADQMDRYALDYQLHSIKIENTTATKMEQQITKLFAELIKNSLAGQAPVIISDDLSNVLVIAATADDYSKIQYLISQVDVATTAESTLPRVFYLKYANAEDMETVLNKLLTGIQPNTGAPGAAAAAGQAAARPTNTLRSSVSSDKSTNAIIAIGDQELYSNVERMIEKLDIPRKQVYVEALILETSVDRSNSFGVEWFAGGASGDTFGFANSSPVDGGSLGGIIGSVADGGIPAVSSLPGGFSAGIIGDVVVYNGIQFPSLGAFLSAVRNDAATNIVSNPQILTMDNEEAEVFVGENRPFLTSDRYDSNNNLIQSYDYRNVGVRLKVIPHISGDDVVNLEIEQEVDKVGAAVSGGSVTLTRTTKTKVQLYDRSIVVIGGLMKDDSTVQTSGIPFLSSIPILGWLFKTESLSTEKTNLMVFITATIIHTQNDANSLMERRVQGTSLFNSQVTNRLTDKLGDDGNSFIPMQQDVNEMLFYMDYE